MLGGRPLETVFISFTAPDRLVAGWPLSEHDSRDRVRTLARWLLERSDTKSAAPILLSLLMAYGELARPSEQDWAERVRRLVERKLAESLTLGDLAAEAGFSRYHFLRIFKQTMGETPMHYVRRIRVEATHALLVNSSCSIKEIARLVGLRDEFHLSRVFKKMTGAAPSKARRP